MLNQVADGVWVRQSKWVWTNAIAVRGDDGLILIDPGIDGSELNQLADDLDGLGMPVVAGFSTHPHWDHLLWHSRFGDVPRYATAACANVASEARERAQKMAAESASGIPLELIGLVTPLPADGGPVPGEIVEHQAHAIGHAAVLLVDRGVLLAGDMLSDVLIPLFDPRQSNQVGAYETALDRLAEAARHVDVLVPGHGAVAEGPEVAARLAVETGSPAPTSRTWSRPEGSRAREPAALARVGGGDGFAAVREDHRATLGLAPGGRLVGRDPRRPRSGDARRAPGGSRRGWAMAARGTSGAVGWS
ncbi:MAG: MBL fold metallo-hydrolase [Chloroflexi bacterium]|nr:MAG: MBL fold metallo-hydrolase [Chloroflexota bacterium]